MAKDLKLKKPTELLTIFNIVEDILNSKDFEEEKFNFDNDNFYIKLFQIKLILEKNLNFEGLTRKVQLRPKKWKKITINENNQIKTKYKIEEALFIIKWGGRITHSGIKQTKLLGNTFRTKLYLSNKQTGEDLLRLHSTYQHDLKCYSSEEGRSLKTAAAFLQGLLQLDGSLIPIVTSMVRNDDKVSKLLDASNSDIEHLRNNVKKNLEELFHAEGNLKDKYNKILFNNIDKTKYNIDKIKRRQKPYYDLIDDIGNFQNEMFNIYELLDSFIKHLKTFLCSEEILTECDTYFEGIYSIRQLDLLPKMLNGTFNPSEVSRADLNFIFFKMFPHDAVDLFEEIPHNSLIIVQINHAGNKIFLFACLSHHSLQIALFNLKIRPDRTPY